MSSPGNHNGRASFVIVGNGNAGTGAAEALRKADADARIVLLGNEPYPLYNRVSLPPFLKLKATEQKVLMRTVEQHAAKGIELHLNVEAQLDVTNKQVHLNSGESFDYDAVLLATGGTPNPLGVPGADKAGGVYYFQTLDDAKAISHHLETATHGVTFGSSFISYELTEAFAVRSVPTTWIMRGSRFLHRILDEEGGELVKQLAAEQNVDILPFEEPGEVLVDNGCAVGAVTKNGKRVMGDVVGTGFGLHYYVEVCAGTPVETNVGIITDEHLETNVPGVFSAGDVAEFFDVNLGKRRNNGTWESAGLAGRLAAQNMLATVHDEPLQVFNHVPSYTSTLFESRITVFGVTPAETSGLESETGLETGRRSYKRLFFRGPHLVGGALIGPATRDRLPLIQAMRAGREIAPSERRALLDLTNAAGAREPEEEVA